MGKKCDMEDYKRATRDERQAIHDWLDQNGLRTMGICAVASRDPKPGVLLLTSLKDDEARWSLVEQRDADGRAASCLKERTFPYITNAEFPWPESSKTRVSAP